MGTALRCSGGTGRPGGPRRGLQGLHGPVGRGGYQAHGPRIARLRDAKAGGEDGHSRGCQVCLKAKCRTLLQ
eukprot:771443-Pyramimonas_sp.AAC.1